MFEPPAFGVTIERPETRALVERISGIVDAGPTPEEFLPQFVAADASNKALAFLVLGLIFVVNGTLYCLALAAFAARAADRLRRSGSVLQWINRGLGALFVALGIRVALARA